jgi:hypothetical protein
VIRISQVTRHLLGSVVCGTIFGNSFDPTIDLQTRCGCLPRASNGESDTYGHGNDRGTDRGDFDDARIANEMEISHHCSVVSVER